MKSPRAACIIRLIAVFSCLCLLPSCKLVRSVAKIPGSIIKTTGRTLGISNLTDHRPRSIEAKAASRQLKRSQESEATTDPIDQPGSSTGQ